MQQIVEDLYGQLFRDIKRGTKKEREIFKDTIDEFIYNGDVLSLAGIRHHVKTNRLMHCLHVSYRCFLTSYRHGLDYKSAAIGGLLHDFCFSMKGENNKENIKDVWCFYHPRIALEEASKRFEIDDITKDIICTHMFPIAFSFPKYKETFVIIFWDKQCALKEVISKKNNNI